MRLIDKDALAARLEDECKEWEGESAYQAGLCAAAVIVAEAPTVKQEPTVGGWISVKDRLPPEKETIFARFKGTDQWNPAMFAISSEDVRVVVRFEDGTRRVWHDNTMDGKWKCEREKCAYPKRIVTHWMPNPELPKEDENVG